jgi:hypothetical protein
MHGQVRDVERVAYSAVEVLEHDDAQGATFRQVTYYPQRWRGIDGNRAGERVIMSSQANVSPSEITDALLRAFLNGDLWL